MDLIVNLENTEYMYENGTHSVKDSIVSISQPYIRPIMRGKAKAPVEFGAKLDMSINEGGFARLDRHWGVPDRKATRNGNEPIWITRIVSK